MSFAEKRGVSMPAHEVDKRLEMSGVDKLFLHICRREDSPSSAAFLSRVHGLTAEALAEDRPLFLHGPPRTGKTLTLTYLARRLTLAGTPLLYFHAGRMADAIRNDPTYGRYMAHRLIGVSHVFIDDVGAAYDKSGYFHGWLLDIVDARYGAKRPTSSACNDLSVVEARIARRLAEHALVKELVELT
jgi:DNA replication protein DnaC